MAALFLGGCAVEPWDRDGAWRATGTNDANLRAMIVDPAHLSRGAQPATPARAEAAALAAGRLAFPSTPSAGVPTSAGMSGLPPLRTSNVGQ
jgi:hypothetical protein